MACLLVYRQRYGPSSSIIPKSKGNPHQSQRFRVAVWVFYWEDCHGRMDDEFVREGSGDDGVVRRFYRPTPHPPSRGEGGADCPFGTVRPHPLSLWAYHYPHLYRGGNQRYLMEKP